MCLDLISIISLFIWLESGPPFYCFSLYQHLKKIFSSFSDFFWNIWIFPIFHFNLHFGFFTIFLYHYFDVYSMDYKCTFLNFHSLLQLIFNHFKWNIEALQTYRSLYPLSSILLLLYLLHLHILESTRQCYAFISFR